MTLDQTLEANAAAIMEKSNKGLDGGRDACQKMEEKLKEKARTVAIRRKGRERKGSGWFQSGGSKDGRASLLLLCLCLISISHTVHTHAYTQVEPHTYTQG